MIKYALVCASGHEFESWFASSTSFEEQARRGFVTCPDCGSARVERAIMAPSVARTDLPRPAAEPQTTAAPAAAPAPAPAAGVALLGEREQALRQMIVALHEHVRANAENVGSGFAEEAIKIHHGESEERAIYGEANAEDAERLAEEGVPFLPLPRLPDAGN